MTFSGLTKAGRSERRPSPALPTWYTAAEMVPPLRVDLAKLSHVHVLGLLLPFVPGIVMTAGLTLGHSSMVRQFEAIPLGYNTKLAVAVGLTYVIGMALMTVTQACTDSAMMLFKPPSGAGPWNNTYLRRVAASYLGSTLLPDAKPASSDDMEMVAKYMLAVTGKPSQFPSLTALRKTVERSEEILKKANDDLANGGQLDMDALTITRIKSATEQRRVLDEIEKGLRTVVADVEWVSLYGALQFLVADVQHPFESVQLLTASLEAAAVGSIGLMIQVHELSNPVAMSFAIVLFMAAIRAQWLLFQVNSHSSNYGLRVTAAMIKQLQQRSDREAGPEKS